MPRPTLLAVSALALGLALPGANQHIPTPETHPPRRIVALGAGVAETVVALGASEKLVAVDSGSQGIPGLPEGLSHLAYIRAQSAEPILALRPDLVLADETTGPPHVLAQLRAAGLKTLVVAAPQDVEGSFSRIQTLARALELEKQGNALVKRIRREVDKACAPDPQDAQPKPRVLCFYARASNALHAFGQGTPPDTLIALAGGRNALDIMGSVELTTESTVTAAPDVFVVLAESSEALGGLEALCERPGLSATPAARAQRVVVLDHSSLIDFGPRLGEAIGRLRAAIEDAR